MLRVLIADDESKVCQLIEKLVDWDALGMEVVAVAENGIEALEKIKEFHPDIVITDIRMPGPDPAGKRGSSEGRVCDHQRLPPF